MNTKKTLCRPATPCSRKAPRRQFYNTSEYSLVALRKFPNDIGENFTKYLDGLSANVKDILFDFSGGEQKGLAAFCETLLRKRLPFKIAKEFAPDKTLRDELSGIGIAGARTQPPSTR